MQHGLNRLARMPAVSIINSHMQGEVVGIDIQLMEFEGADQQMQRQLFVAKIVADRLGHELVAMISQCQLQGALKIVFVAEWRRVVAAVFGQ